MIIGGLQKLSMVDYPGYMCATVFFYGCNLRCPFCHNAALVTGKCEEPFCEEEIIDYLNKRKNMLDAVCITGGEATLNDDLLSFMQKVKSLGYRIKLDSNGTKPDAIKRIISFGTVDYIAIDIKNSKEKYSLTCGREVNLDDIQQSIDIIKSSGIEYEFRTTVCNPLHTKDDIINIAKWLSGAKRYAIQQYSSDGEQIASEGFSRFNPDVIRELLDELKIYFGDVIARGL